MSTQVSRPGARSVACANFFFSLLWKCLSQQFLIMAMRAVNQFVVKEIGPALLLSDGQRRRPYIHMHHLDGNLFAERVATAYCSWRRCRRRTAPWLPYSAMPLLNGRCHRVSRGVGGACICSLVRRWAVDGLAGTVNSATFMTGLGLGQAMDGQFTGATRLEPGPLESRQSDSTAICGDRRQ